MAATGICAIAAVVGAYLGSFGTGAEDGAISLMLSELAFITRSTGSVISTSLAKSLMLVQSAFIAGVSGGVSAAVLELLRPRATSLLSRIVGCGIILTAGFAAGFVASLALPGNLITVATYTPTGLVLGLYGVALSAFGLR